MEDVSPLVGEVAVSVAGKDFIIDNAGWDDWSVFKHHFIAERGDSYIQAVYRMKGKVDDAEYKDMRREAIERAAKEKEISQDELRAILGSRDGMAFMLWAILERRYPQTVTRQECLDAINKAHVTEGQLEKMTDALFTSMGWQMEEPEGNAKSQGETGEKMPVSGEAA